MVVMNVGDVLWSWYLYGMVEGGKWFKILIIILIL